MIPKEKERKIVGKCVSVITKPVDIRTSIQVSFFSFISLRALRPGGSSWVLSYIASERGKANHRFDEIDESVSG